MLDLLLCHKRRDIEFCSHRTRLFFKSEFYLEANAKNVDLQEQMLHFLQSKTSTTTIWQLYKQKEVVHFDTQLK